MSNAPRTNIATATLRANANYELVLFDRLSPEQQHLLCDLQRDPTFFGILRPRAPSLFGIKSICRDTALLYYTLQTPGPAPTYLDALFGDRINQALAELVLDGVLEIEQDDRFVSGPDAYTLLYEAAAPTIGHGATARLSLAALRYAQALELDSVNTIAARLYFYNRQPASAQWRRMFGSSAAVATYLGLETGTLQRTLHRAWSSTTMPTTNDGWFAWHARSPRPVPADASSYKLYISPHCNALRDTFQAVVETLTAQQVPAFKIGKDMYGLLRPDKIVAYFWSFEALSEAAEQLRLRLDGVPAQGVPFTADLGGDGLLSWGIDPPRSEQLLSWQERESWRSWITNRLAGALLAAKTATLGTVEPWQFALERLRLDGVDTSSWTPAETLWHTDSIAEGQSWR